MSISLILLGEAYSSNHCSKLLVLKLPTIEMDVFDRNSCQDLSRSDRTFVSVTGSLPSRSSENDVH
jgi:hypothetical protein